MYETAGYYPDLSGKKNQSGGLSIKGQEQNEDNIITVIPANELLRNTGWKKTALLLLMGNLGAGVLTIPYAFTLVGLIPGLTICLIMAFVSRYTGVLLTRVFVKNQECQSMGALAERLCGPRYAQFVYGLVYSYLFVLLSYYLVVASKAIRDIKNMCIYSAALYSGVLLLPFIQLRTLGEISYLGILSFLTIFVVVVMCLQQAGEYEVNVANNLYHISNVYDLFSATGTVGFAYCGHWMYTEIMYEMRDPKEFVTCLNVNSVTLFVTYTMTGGLGWYLAGNDVPAYLLDVIPVGSMRSAAAFFMLFHVICTMLPRAQILIRALHHKVDEASLDAFHHASAMFWRATGLWLLISILLYVGMFIVMNTLPFFDDLVVLLGCLFDPTFTLITPAALF